MLLKNPLSRKSFSVLAILILFIVAVPLLLTRMPVIYLPLPLGVITYIHLSRNDADLLRKSGLNSLTIMFAEYLILSLPYIIVSFVYAKYLAAIALLVFVISLVISTFLYRRPSFNS